MRYTTALQIALVFCACGMEVTMNAGEASAMNSQQLGALVKKASEVLWSLKEFRAVVDKKSLFPGYQQYVCQAIRNGKTFSKIYFANEKGDVLPNSTIVLENEKGSWMVYQGRVAVMKKFGSPDPKQTNFLLLLNGSENNNFSSEPTDIAGEPGLIVTESFSDSFKKKLASEWGAVKEQIPIFATRQMTLTSIRYWIRLKDGIEVRRSYLESGGKIVFESGYKDIDTSVHFPDDFFSVPPDVPIKTATSAIEMNAILSDTKPRKAGE